MKIIKISRGFETIVDDEDFEWLNKFIWTAIPKGDGRVYATRMSRRSYKNQPRHILQMHREITNAPKGMVVDHINHNTLDNRKENLRVCTHAENMRNRKLQSNNKYGFPGLYFDERLSKPWMALIRNGGKRQLNLGSFDTKEEAMEAYKEASIKYHKEFSPFYAN